jgi:hypothetical protein
VRWARVTIGGAPVIPGGIVEVLLRVKAEGRQLEQVARPLTAVPPPSVPGATAEGARLARQQVGRAFIRCSLTTGQATSIEARDVGPKRN